MLIIQAQYPVRLAVGLYVVKKLGDFRIVLTSHCKKRVPDLLFRHVELSSNTNDHAKIVVAVLSEHLDGLLTLAHLEVNVGHFLEEARLLALLDDLHGRVSVSFLQEAEQSRSVEADVKTDLHEVKLTREALIEL